MISKCEDVHFYTERGKKQQTTEEVGKSKEFGIVKSLCKTTWKCMRHLHSNLQVVLLVFTAIQLSREDGIHN